MSEQDNNLFIEEGEEDGKPTKEDRVLGAICYAHFLFLAPFFMEKDTEFLKFHMKQGGILYILFILVNFIGMVFLPFSISWRIVGILWMAYTGMGVFAGYKAYKGEKYEFPFLSSLIEFVGERMNEKK